MGIRALSAVDCGYRTVLVSRGLARAALKDDEEEQLLLRAIAGRHLHYFLFSSRTLAAFDGFLFSSFLQELRSWVRTGFVSDSIADLNFGILGVRERERERERERDAGAVDLCFLDIRQTGLGFEEQRADHLGCSLGDWIRGAGSFEACIWDLEYLATGWLRRETGAGNTGAAACHGFFSFCWVFF